MSYAAQETYQTNTRLGRPRVQVGRIQPKTFKLGSGTLAILTPMAMDKSTGFLEPWAPPVTEVTTITKTGTVSGGTYTITVDGVASAAIAYNASNATILAALTAMSNIGPEDVVLSGGGAAGVSTGALTLTWAGRFKGQNIAVTTGSGSLTGGGTYDVAEATAGVDKLNGLGNIHSFVWPDAVTLDGTGEVLGNVLMSGTIHVSDIPLVSPVLLTTLKTALREDSVRAKGFLFQGLTGA